MNQTRRMVFICNLLIVVLCLASILSYFMMPFWKVNVKYTMTAEALQQLLPQDEPTPDGEGESGDEPIDAEDVWANLDFNEVVGEDGITLKMSISLETSDILSALKTEPTALVESILDGNVHNLVDQLDETIGDIVKKVVKLVVKTALTEGVKEQIKESLGADATDEETRAELNAAGLTDEYLDDKANQLVDSIYQEGATADTAADSTIAIVEESIQKMKESGNPDYADIELSEEAKADLKADLVEQFKQFENEDGSIDPEAFTSDFLLNMLKDSSEQSSESTPESFATIATPLSASPETEETVDEEDAKAELRQLLTDKLMGAIDDAEETVAIAIKALSYVIIVTFAIWALPILKILLRMKKHNNAIKLGLPIWFGSIPSVVLCLIPTLATSFLSSPPAALAGVMGDLGALSGLSITFTSCSMVSFFIGIALAVFVLFFYGKQRKILKRGGGRTVQKSEPASEESSEA